MFNIVLKKRFVLAISADFSGLIENSCDIFAEVGCLLVYVLFCWDFLSGFAF